MPSKKQKLALAKSQSDIPPVVNPVIINPTTEDDFETKLKAAFESETPSIPTPPQVVDTCLLTALPDPPVIPIPEEIYADPIPTKSHKRKRLVPRETSSVKFSESQPQSQSYSCPRSTPEQEPSDKDKWFEMLEQYVLLFPDVCKMPPSITANSSPEDIKLALDKAQKQVQIHNELKLARTGLLATVGMVETVSTFLPYIELQGMTDNVSASIETFDSVLKELSIKYIANMAPSPEMMLLMMIARIGFTTHITNKRTVHPQPVVPTPSNYNGLNEHAQDARSSLFKAAGVQV